LKELPYFLCLGPSQESQLCLPTQALVDSVAYSDLQESSLKCPHHSFPLLCSTLLYPCPSVSLKELHTPVSNLLTPPSILQLLHYISSFFSQPLQYSINFHLHFLYSYCPRLIFSIIPQLTNSIMIFELNVRTLMIELECHSYLKVLVKFCWAHFDWLVLIQLFIWHNFIPPLLSSSQLLL